MLTPAPNSWLRICWTQVRKGQAVTGWDASPAVTQPWWICWTLDPQHPLPGWRVTWLPSHQELWPWLECLGHQHRSNLASGRDTVTSLSTASSLLAPCSYADLPATTSSPACLCLRAFALVSSETSFPQMLAASSSYSRLCSRATLLAFSNSRDGQPHLSQIPFSALSPL